jgi:PAS domain S-box-containing protein
VPLIREGHVIGMLAVGNREGGYTQTEQNALEALVPSIVEAFARIRAEEERLKATTELQAANTKLIDSRRATLNMIQDAVIARRWAEETSLELRSEVVERKQAENALRRAKEEWERTFESVPDLITILDNNHRVLRVNEAMARRLGVKPEECIGLRCYEAVHGTPCPPEFCPHSRTIVDGCEHVEEVHEDRLGGDFLVTTTPLLDENGVRIGSVHIAHDITDRKQAEAKLQALNQELEMRVEERTLDLQKMQNQYLHAEKLSAIGKLSASIAHEFNNPLQGILSILKGLKKRAIMEEEDRELLDAAIGEGDRIKDLIRSLKDFNRPSSGRKSFIDVHQSLDALLLLQKSDFNGRRISVERKYKENLPQIMVVPDQVKQVFLNLLANAADACNHHGGVITVSTWQENDKVAVAIKDTGTGIKPEDMEHIFRPFFTTKAEVKGTGLGLPVSYGIVKNHQGNIQVKSQPGEGSTFTVILPIRADLDF